MTTATTIGVQQGVLTQYVNDVVVVVVAAIAVDRPFSSQGRRCKFTSINSTNNTSAALAVTVTTAGEHAVDRSIDPVALSTIATRSFFFLQQKSTA